MMLKHKDTGMIIEKELIQRCKRERTKLAIQCGGAFNISVKEYSYEDMVFGDDFLVVNEDDFNIKEMREIAGVFYYLRREDRPIVQKINKKIKELIDLASKTREIFE